MLDQFLDFVSRNQLCSKHEVTLLAVSGGIDSTVMFYLFKEAGFRMAVAHANFQLRGDDSDGDEEFVTTLCKTFNVPLFTRRFETEHYAWEKSLSIQLAARELRYAWFAELMKQEGISHLATAHHFDDSMETVLLNFTRGAGLEALAGIPVKNGSIIRPMMFASRKQVEQHAAKHGIVWREDASNQTDNYQRNFIRHNVMPLLRTLNPSLDITWRKGQEKAGQELVVMHGAFNAWKETFVKEQKGKFVIAKAGIEKNGDNPVLLWRFIRNFGFNYDQAGDIQRGMGGQSGKQFFSGSHTLTVDRDQLIVAGRRKDWSEIDIDEQDSAFNLGPWWLTVSVVRDIHPEALKNGEANAVIDASKLSFPLTWRKWRAGDYFYPLGLGHRKKLSDFFIDARVSMADKADATVVESGGEIVWVAGRRIDDRFKVTDKTEKCILFTISHL